MPALFAAILLVYIPFVFGYIQSELNKVWRNQEVTDPLPGLQHPGLEAALPATARPAPPLVSNVPPQAIPAPEVATQAPQQSPAGQQATPANWYPDPWSEARLRYWDGDSWTGHTAA